MNNEQAVIRKLIIETDPKTKARWVATSNRDQMKLHDWVIETLNDNAWFDDERAPGNRKDS